MTNDVIEAIIKIAIIGLLAWSISDTAKEFKNLKNQNNGRK